MGVEFCGVNFIGQDLRNVGKETKSKIAGLSDGSLGRKRSERMYGGCKDKYRSFSVII